MYKSMILLLLCFAWLFGQAGPSGAGWHYRMQGNLDEANLRCRGAAQVTSKSEAGRLQCISWRIPKPQCTGDRSVDWLHEDDNGGEICQAPTSWELKKQLPGRAVCVPHVVTKDGKLISFSLSCTWECRSAKEACAGQATYEFSSESGRR